MKFSRNAAGVRVRKMRVPHSFQEAWGTKGETIQSLPKAA